MPIDYQSLLYDPIYQTLGVAVTLTTVDDQEVSLTALNLTKPSSFNGFGVDFQTFQPAVKIRMSELSGLSLQDDILGGELLMDGETWDIKSYERNASPNGNSDGELRLLLSKQIQIAVPGGGYVLREDGSFVLREDDSKVLREG